VGQLGRSQPVTSMWSAAVDPALRGSGLIANGSPNSAGP
jgi:hypothetical protein